MDIPIQHASDRILKRMGRRTNRKEITRAASARLREEIPDIALRTTLITGFPGETEEDHGGAYATLWMRWNLNDLAYLPIPRRRIRRRQSCRIRCPRRSRRSDATEMMELQQEIAFEHGQDMIGKRAGGYDRGKGGR